MVRDTDKVTLVSGNTKSETELSVSILSYQTQLVFLGSPFVRFA